MTRSLVLRSAAITVVHTFRGSNFKPLLGLENERKVIARYRALREIDHNNI